MDWQVIVGIGLALVSLLFPYLVKDIPWRLALLGMAMGVILVIWGVRERIKEVLSIKRVGDTDLQRLDKITEWSVTFRIKQASGFSTGLPREAPNLPFHVTFHDCQFVNVSRFQRRVIDVKFVIPTNDPDNPTLTLDTHTTDFRFYDNENFRAARMGSGIDAMGTRGMLFNTPIVLEPSTSLEGVLVFPLDDSTARRLNKTVSEAIREGDMFKVVYGGANVFGARVYVTEQLSGRTIGPVKLNEKYDATTGTIVTQRAAQPGPDLDRGGRSAKVSAGLIRAQRGLIGAICGAVRLKPKAFSLAIDPKPIFQRARRYFSFWRP
jgi:hypothetical protein